MKTLVFSGICAVVLLCVTGASAEQVDKLSEALADNDTPQSIACAQERGVSLGQCSYSIKEDENGKSTVTVVFANGFKRSLFFKDGEFLKASVTMSGVGTNTGWVLKDGTHFIHVDGQRYEVPDTLIAGK